jgi:hypothetical protein
MPAFGAFWRWARMAVQAGRNESSFTSRASSERVLKIAGLLPGLPHLPMSERSSLLLPRIPLHG